MNTFFKVLAFLLAIFFIWAAAVQYNDPDAIKWYVIYGTGALASILFALGKLKFLWALFLFGVYLGLSIFNWPDVFEGVTLGEGDIVNIEKGREALGTGILAVVMLIYALRIRYTASKSKV